MNKRFVFDKTSITLLVLGIIGLIIGYLVMATGDITLSPIILTITYLILFPAAIIAGLFKRKERQ